MRLVASSLAGTIAALLAAVDLVSEKNRNVYVLFVIRPIRREAIIIAKFIAVCGCVTIACVFAIVIGFLIDAGRGESITSARLHDAGKAVISMVEVIAMSAAVGVPFGVMALSILVAVVLVVDLCQH